MSPGDGRYGKIKLPTLYSYPMWCIMWLSADKRAATARTWDRVPLKYPVALVKCPLSFLGAAPTSAGSHLAALPGLSSLRIWGL